uniref:Uncharacterized protein n=1 Tax=Cannabis sativa TaxID=3483 RepID=A0A803PUJ9_CANSA
MDCLPSRKRKGLVFNASHYKKFVTFTRIVRYCAGKNFYQRNSQTAMGKRILKDNKLETTYQNPNTHFRVHEVNLGIGLGTAPRSTVMVRDYSTLRCYLSFYMSNIDIHIIRPTFDVNIFILCVDGLSTLLGKFETKEWLHGCKLANGAIRISHMLFADDSYLYCKGTMSVVVHV